MEKVKFDYSKLKGKITEVCETQKAFAERLGINESTLTAKLKGNSNFTQEEILKSLKILGIVASEMADYFFAV